MQSHSDRAVAAALARCRAAAPVAKALASEMRLRILDVLRKRRYCTVGKLAKAIGVDASTVSQHVAILRRVGLVRSEKKGQWVICEVTPAGRRALHCCKQMVECVVERSRHEGSRGHCR